MAVSLTNRAEVLCQTRVEKVTSLKAHKHFFEFVFTHSSKRRNGKKETVACLKQVRNIKYYSQCTFYNKYNATYIRYITIVCKFSIGLILPKKLGAL